MYAVCLVCTHTLSFHDEMPERTHLIDNVATKTTALSRTLRELQQELSQLRLGTGLGRVGRAVHINYQMLCIDY